MSQRETLKKQAKKFPNSSGVYLWLDKGKKPLYVGRAGSLKKRVASYFRTNDPRIAEMVDSAKSITFEKTDTLLEAIVLEANLIKKHWPKYNVRDKDNKSFIYLVITDPSAGSGQADEYPRLLAVRGRELEKYSVVIPRLDRGIHVRSRKLDPRVRPEDDSRKMAVKAIFGPYQSYWLLRKALEMVRRIFPYSTDKGVMNKACFHYQIGLCPGVCVGTVSRIEYQKNIRNLILFFRGDKKRLVAKLKKEGSEDQIKALTQVNDVALLADSNSMLRQASDVSNRRIEGYDISHLAGKEPVGAMVVFENGEKDPSQYRLFKIRGLMANGYRLAAVSQDDLAMLKEVLERRLKHKEWPMPDIVFVDGGLNQVRAVNRVLVENNLHVPVVGLSKAGKHAGSAYSEDKLVILNTKKIGMELIIASKKLFQEVRNEAHRFAISFGRKKRRYK